MKGDTAMELIRNNNGTYTLVRDVGSVDLTANEVSFLVNQFMRQGLRDSIESLLHEADGDTIDLSRAPYGFDDLVEEIFTDLADEVDYGNPPDDDDIRDKIQDVCDYYDMGI